MIKKKYSHRTIHDAQIQKLYLAAKAVAVPQVISEQMCSGGVGAAVWHKARPYFHRGVRGHRLLFGYVRQSEMLCAQ